MAKVKHGCRVVVAMVVADSVLGRCKRFKAPVDEF